MSEQSFIISQKGSSEIRTWFDGMGRTYQTSETGPGSQCFVSFKFLDFAGRVTDDYLPRLEGTCPTSDEGDNIGSNDRATSYQYDPIGRTTVVTNTDGTAQTTAYAIPSATPGAINKQVVIDANGHKKAFYNDASNKLVKVDEFKGNTGSYSLYATTVYTYDLLGNMTSVEDAKGNVTSISCDWLGRKLSMSDPDMGDWTYDYDAAGNLTQQVDAKNQEMNFEYDELGRMTKKLEGASPVITYTYDSEEVSNGKGQRTGMEDSSGSTTWSYNERGKVSEEVKTITGSGTYTTSYSYDSLERLVDTTYPDGEVVTNDYNSWGPLSQVTSSLVHDQATFSAITR